jgi:hypothetical protein
MKNHILKNIYWILDAVQKGEKPKMQDVVECFISVRDELMQPDTEQIVDHIRDVLERSSVSADALSSQVIANSRRRPLSQKRLEEMMATLSDSRYATEIAVPFARCVEAAHGIGKS